MRRSHWAWGPEPDLAELHATARLIAEATGLSDAGELATPVPLEEVRLPPSRVPVPLELEGFCNAEPYDRVVHSHGQGYRDLVRAFHGVVENAPDLVAYPTNEDEIEAVLEWCGAQGVKAIPWGGGTSVVGGVEPRFDEPAITLDLSRFDRVLAIDPVSRAALIEAGANGPRVNAQLGGGDLQLRFFPQSYEFSTLGGWIATRAGGHYATLHTHIDDLVESVRAVTPSGIWESRRLPGSGAGPSPDRMLLGSEGTLGVITRAWVRLQARPTHKVSVPVRFATFGAGAAAVHDLAQSGLHPANCRLIDAAEARLTSGGDGEHALLVLGFESADHSVEPLLARALELAAAHGGTWDEVRRSRQDSAWRETFLHAPYLRNAYPAAGLVVETVETAVTWDRFEAFHAAIMGAVGQIAAVTCRIAFAYPDGPAPYYTVMATASKGGEVEQWDAIKRVASDAIVEAGGTITHHHAVGRDHRPWYDRQRPDPFAQAFRAAKDAIDPAGVLNPGVLINGPG